MKGLLSEKLGRNLGLYLIKTKEVYGMFTGRFATNASLGLHRHGNWVLFCENLDFLIDFQVQK
ncbi:MAG: hypothetical protein MUC59_10335 [Saprospiraceae bacterium]|nr:hypothetical protein [Saprospiraceae bacterium]